MRLSMREHSSDVAVAGSCGGGGGPLCIIPGDLIGPPGPIIEPPPGPIMPEGCSVIGARNKSA
eukprot:10462749-Ditylum_brightwellii.AAC.1